MIRRLILMRHAKSDRDDHRLVDHDRPLNKRGRQDAPRMAQHMADHDMLPQVIMASTAERVRETLGLMLVKWRTEPVVFFEKSLYLASSNTLLTQLRGLHDSWDNVLFLGHNPGLSDFASTLCHAPIELPTAAVLALESEAHTWLDALAADSWRTVANWNPREVLE